MEEDTEVLDWGHEEDDYQSYDTRRSRENIGEPRHHADEDCDDTVSLGGDEDDFGVVYAYQSRSYQEKSKSFETSRHYNRDHHRESSHTSTRQPSHISPPHSSHQYAKLTHALPAKPVIVNPSVAVAQSQLLEASSMVNGRDRDRRNSIKKPVGEPMPPDWEIRYPRSGGSEVYYYNTKTHESTWVRPTLAPPKDSWEENEGANGTFHQSTGRSRAKSPSHDHASPLKSRTEPILPEDMSFDDRHYRPIEAPTPGSRAEHILPQKPAFGDRRSPERLPSAESSRHAHRSQAEPERARSRRGASPPNVRPPSPESRRQEAGREPRSRPSRMDSYIPPTDRTHTSTHDERDIVRPSANRRPAPARDSPHGQETRSDYDSYIPSEELPRSRRARRSRSTSPRVSNVRDTEGEEVVRHEAVARRRPRDPETDVIVNEVETKRRRLDGLREPDRLSPPSISQCSSAGGNESLHGVPAGESRQKRPPLPPQKSLYKESRNSHVREPPSAQLPESSGPPSRQNGHGPDPASRSRNLESQPPSGPGGRRGRAGDSRKPPMTELMDVDPQAPVHPPKMQESRNQPNATADRDDTKGDLPRGPKAMKLPPAPPASLPPKPATVSARYSGRSPPPHLIAHDERPPHRTGDRTIVDSHSDRHRDVPKDHHTLEVAPSRRRSPDSRRPPTAPGPKLSGTNNVPIARSRYQPPPTAPTPDGPDEPRQDRILESNQSLPNTSIRQTRNERSAVPDRTQVHVHELPDRPPPYQGPPALERRESNRSRQERADEQPLDRRGSNNSRVENYPEGSGARRNQLPPGAKVIYERPSPSLTPQHERDSLEASVEKRTKLEPRRHNVAHLPPESHTKSDRTERVRIDRERAIRQEDRRRPRGDGGNDRRHRADTANYHIPLERRLSSYERQTSSPNELPPPSPPSQTGNREDHDHPSTSGYDDRNYGRGSERTRTPSPSRHRSPPQQFRGLRAYDDGGDGRRLPARPRSPNSDIGERGYGKVEVRSAMSSRGGSLLDRLSADNRMGERDAMEDRFDDRGAVTDVNTASNGHESAGERRDNGRRRRKIKGGRR